MNYQCCFDNCVTEPVAYCLCEGIPSLFCLEDSLEHSRNYKDHKILDIKTSPLSKSHQGLLKMTKIKTSLIKIKKSLLTESLKVVELIENSIQNCQNNINELVNDCDEVFRLTLQIENNKVINRGSLIPQLASDQIQNKLKQ